MSLQAKFLSTLTLFAAFAAFSTAAMAQDASQQPTQDSTVKQKKSDRKGFGMDKPRGEGFRGKHRGGKGGMMFGLRGVNLTDAQKGQMRSIRESNRPDPATMQQMRSLMQAKRDGTITAEQQEQFKTLRQQAREKGESVHQQIMAIFTPEQLQQIEQNKQEMKKRFEERRQMREQNKPVPDKPTDN